MKVLISYTAITLYFILRALSILKELNYFKRFLTSYNKENSTFCIIRNNGKSIRFFLYKVVLKSDEV